MGMNQGNWGAFISGGVSGAEKEQQMEKQDLQNRYEKDAFVDPASRNNKYRTEQAAADNTAYGSPQWHSQGMLFDPVRNKLADVYQSAKAKLSSFLPGQGQHAMGPAAQSTVPGQSNVAASPPGPDTSGPAQPGLPGAGAVPRSDNPNAYFGDGGPIPPRNAGALRSRKPKPGNIAKPSKAARGAMNPELEQPVSMPRNTEPTPSNQDPMLADGGWIKGAVKHPGALHEDLGVPQGQKIPKGKLDAAAKQKGKVGQRARFAETVSKFSNGGIVPKPKAFPMEANPKPQPNSLERDVTNDGQRNRLGKTIKRFADGGGPAPPSNAQPEAPPEEDLTQSWNPLTGRRGTQPATGLTPAAGSPYEWPGVGKAAIDAGKWLNDKVGEPYAKYADWLYAPVGATAETILTGSEHGLEPDAGQPPAKPPASPVKPRKAQPKVTTDPDKLKDGPPVPFDDDPAALEHGQDSARMGPGGTVTRDENGNPITPYSIAALRGNVSGVPGGGGGPASQGPPKPTPAGAPPSDPYAPAAAAPVDFSQVQMDHRDIPNTSTQEWEKMKQGLVHELVQTGQAGVAQASMLADDKVSQFQHQNFMQYMQQGIALDRAGNKQGAMAALKTAYNYMPTGHGMHFGIDPKTNNIVGVGFDEDTQKPVGSPVMLDQQNLNHLLATYSDPKNFQGETLAMMEQKRKDFETAHGAVPLQRATGQEALQRGQYYADLIQGRHEDVQTRANAQIAARGQQDHSLALQTAIQKASPFLEPESVMRASVIADQLIRTRGMDQEQAASLAGMLYSAGVDPTRRQQIAQQYGIQLPPE